MMEIRLCLQIDAPVERCFDLARSIEVHLLGTEKTGERVVGGVSAGLMGMGDFVRWRAKHIGVWQHLASRITAFTKPTYFQDTMIEGAFRWMQHDQGWGGEDGNAGCVSVCGSGAGDGWVVERLVLRRYMTNLLRERNVVIKRVAESAGWEGFLVP